MKKFLFLIVPGKIWYDSLAGLVLHVHSEQVTLDRGWNLLFSWGWITALPLENGKILLEPLGLWKRISVFLQSCWDNKSTCFIQVGVWYYITFFKVFMQHLGRISENCLILGPAILCLLCDSISSWSQIISASSSPCNPHKTCHFLVPKKELSCY